jgi:adenosine deaminase
MPLIAPPLDRQLPSTVSQSAIPCFLWLNPATVDGDILRSLSKVDLHRHLEGTLRLSTIIDLARQAGADLPAWTPDELAGHAQIREPVGGLEEALQRFAVAQASFRTYDAVRRITREAVEDLAADNVRLAELRFSPAFMCSPAHLDWDGTLEAILGGLDDAAHLDVAVGLIAIASRDLGEGSARRTVEWTVRHRDRFVGFDVAGPEIGYRPATFREVLAPIRDSGLGLTTHYGESGPPEYPREAIEVLGTQRLGHGVSVAWDPEVTALALERGVTMEMCPTSNFLTRAVPSIEDHPARKLLGRGMRITINTDNPGLFGIDLTHELTAARDRLAFTGQDLRRVMANALEASFLPEGVKTEVERRHFGWIRSNGEESTLQ